MDSVENFIHVQQKISPANQYVAMKIIKIFIQTTEHIYIQYISELGKREKHKTPISWIRQKGKTWNPNFLNLQTLVLWCRVYLRFIFNWSVIQRITSFWHWEESDLCSRMRGASDERSIPLTTNSEENDENMRTFRCGVGWGSRMESDVRVGEVVGWGSDDKVSGGEVRSEGMGAIGL